MKELDDYTNLVYQLEAIKADKRAMIDKLLPDYIKQGLKDIDEEFDPNIATCEANIEAAKKLVAKAVVEIGESVSNATHIAVYAKPSVTWDTKGLAAYALRDPNILLFEKIGEPSVRIRLKGN